MNLSEIAWPIYPLPREPVQNNGLTYYLYVDSAGEDIVSVIDDKNVRGSTLGLRRLAIKNSGTKLYRLKYAFYFLSDVVKYSKKATWFIDTQGNVFLYKKTTYCPLEFKKIKNIWRDEHGGAVVELYELPTRYKMLYFPREPKTWAGLINYKGAYIIYGLYDRYYEKTIRKI